MCEQLADRDPVLAMLRELRPVSADTLLVVKPASRVGNRERHRREPFARRVDDDHGVALPSFAGVLVANAAPEIDDLLALLKDATRAAQLFA